MNIICKFFGCKPVDNPPPYGPIPCARCAIEDIGYSDLVGDTPFNRLKEKALAPFKRLIPNKCFDCGKRFGNHDDCDELPF